MGDPVTELFNASLDKHKAGDLKGAMEGYNSLLNRNPYDKMLTYLVGNVLLQEGKNGMAINMLEASIRADEKHGAAWNDLGCALKAEHYDAGAAMAWEKAIEYDGRVSSTLNNLATLYADSGYPEKALPYIEEALPLDPTNPHIHWNLALSLLSMGEWQQGWLEHEYRTKVASGNVAKRTYGTPWNGEKDGLLVVHGEQGLGDEIMFATCLPELLAEHPNVVIECEKKLVSLFARSFGRPTYASEDEWRAAGVPEGPIYQIGFGSLPMRYRNADSDFPQRAVLKADPALVEEAQALLGNLPRPIILVSWMGGTKTTRVAHRSLDAKTVKAAVAGIATPVSAQYSGKYADMEADEASLIRLGNWTNGTDLDKLAAMIVAADGVVSVCTTLIHLTGALGKRAHVLTPLRSSWRYGLKSGPGAMAWYPQHTLHRQAVEGDWGPVIESVRAALVEEFA